MNRLLPQEAALDAPPPRPPVSTPTAVNARSTREEKTGAGLEDLKRALVRVAGEAQAKDSTSAPRLPIDRVFTMKGFGTVVTGTLLSGTIRKDAELEVFPGGRRVRVRGVQVHGAAAEQAIAVQRTALNLAGAATEDLERGMTLMHPGVFHTTLRANVQLSLLPSAKPLRDRARSPARAHQRNHR